MNRWQRALVAALLVLWMGLQVRWLTAHWINPDEGAHLMDARLAMEGLIPDLDYGARQPAYVYAYVPFLRVGGTTYAAGRVMPFLAVVATAWLVCLIGRRLWDVHVGAAASLMLLWMPSMVINTAVVKTEPLAMLLTSLGLYGLVRHLQAHRWWPLWMAAGSMALAYYVRESALGGLLAAGLISLSLWRREGGAQAARRLAVLAAGSAAVFLVVMGLYATRLSWREVMAKESLCPLRKITEAVEGIAGWGTPPATVTGAALTAPAVAPAAAVSPIGSGRHLQSWHRTMDNLSEAVSVSLPWVLSAFMAVGLWVHPVPRPPSGGRDEPSAARLPLTIVLAWLGSFTLLYAYYVVERGFFQFYFRELLPPMALLCAVVLRHLAVRLGVPRWWPWMAPTGIVLGLALFGLQRLLGAGGVRLALVAVAAMVIGYVATLRRGGARRAWRPLALAGMALLTTTAVWSVSRAAAMLSVQYDCVWSPQTLREVVGVIRAHSQPSDEVVSGAVIWEFEAGRQPFARITHPLAFVGHMKPAVVGRITTRLRERPPRLIVLDGYTERTYLAGVPAFDTLLRDAYRPIVTVPGSRYPVTVYRRAVEAGTP